MIQSRIVDRLDEKQRKCVAEKVQRQACSNLAGEVFEIQQAIGSCQERERHERVQQVPITSVLPLQLLTTPLVFHHDVREAIQRFVQHFVAQAFEDCEDRQDAPQQQYRAVRDV